MRRSDSVSGRTIEQEICNDLIKIIISTYISGLWWAGGGGLCFKLGLDFNLIMSQVIRTE